MNIDDLLKEREKYQKQIDSATKGIEAVNVLLSLQGYTGSKSEILPAFVSSLIPATNDAGNKPDSLAYSELAREWANSVTGEVTIFDFHNWIKAKHPEATPNKNSMNGPVARLVRDKKLTLVRQGAGRAPSVYGPALL
jgi:hypothetical protein